METTINFKLGLRAAYDALGNEGKLTAQDEKVVGAILANDEITAPNGKRIFAMKRAHIAVRRYYLKQTGTRPLAINWSAIVEWIKEHWLDIVKIILTIVPFLIL